MNMKQLFEDFSIHVNAMDNNDIAKSIQDAIEHTSNSHILDGEIENEDIYIKSPIQETIPVNRTTTNFMFCSFGMSSLKYSYVMSGIGGNAA